MIAEEIAGETTGETTGEVTEISMTTGIDLSISPQGFSHVTTGNMVTTPLRLLFTSNQFRAFMFNPFPGSASTRGIAISKLADVSRII